MSLQCCRELNTKDEHYIYSRGCTIDRVSFIYAKPFMFHSDAHLFHDYVKIYHALAFWTDALQCFSLSNVF